MDPSRHQANQNIYRKYARSLRRSTFQQDIDETMTISSSLNINRSLPPLRESIGQVPPRTTSHGLDSVSLSASVDRSSGGAAANLSDARLKHIKKNLMRRALQGQSYDSTNRDLITTHAHLQDGTATGPNEYNHEEVRHHHQLILPPKFMITSSGSGSREGQNDRYRNRFGQAQSVAIELEGDENEGFHKRSA